MNRNQKTLLLNTKRTICAFTIVEVLVCIGVIALLIGLAFPPLMQARTRARAATSLSNLRGCSQVVALYLAQSADVYPVGQEGGPYSVTISGNGITERLEYFKIPGMWQVLVRNIAPWPEFWRTWYSPGSRPASDPRAAQQFSYPMAHGFIADPLLWQAGFTPQASLLRGIRGSEVLYASSKVLMWDARLAYLARPATLFPGMYADSTPMVFADCHGAEHRPGNASSPVKNQMNPDRAEGSLPLHNTPGGVRGRDY